MEKTKQNVRFSKKILIAVASVIVTIAIIFSTLIIFASKATTFTPRLSAPSTSDYHYTTGNPYYNAGYGMPNCTAYAWGRAYEILGSKPKLCDGNASEWYSYNQRTGAYPYGSTPKLGAILCWSHHVGVVEAIRGNSITVSESHWGGTYFDTVTLTAGNESSYAGAFYGYIYILSDGQASDSPYGVDTAVTGTNGYETGYYVVNTGSSVLNMRSTPNQSGKVLAQIPTGTKLNVTSTKGSWGKTTYNGKTGWVALWYCNPVDEDSTPTGGAVESTTKKTTSATEPDPYNVDPGYDHPLTPKHKSASGEAVDNANKAKQTETKKSIANDTAVGWFINYYLPALLK